MTELESLGVITHFQGSSAYVRLVDSGTLLDPGGTAGSKGTCVIFSEMLANDFSKMHPPFPFSCWSKSVPISPYP